MVVMDDVLLQTERLILRRLCAEDVDDLFELDNDHEVMRYLNGSIPTPRRIFKKEIFPGFLHYDEQHPGYGFWAAVEKSSKVFLGWLSFRPTGPDPFKVTLGFRMRSSAWGRGFASEGARALIDKGFSEMGVCCVRATTYEDNLASRRVLEKIGMKLVRKFRLSAEDLANTDTFHVETSEVWDGYDMAYAITRSEWERSHL